jgi:uncharacterized RDD family membrane protein YckC
MTELVSFSVAAPVALENPFPGLRPFREDEEYLFFGREHQVDKMVDKLAASHFLAVVGTSGTGKSSLVNCGLKPALHRGLMASAGTSWRMVQFRPGGSPIRSMAQAFAQEPGFLDEDEPGGLSLLQITESTLRMSSLGLADLFQFAHLDPGTNLLVVVDQFEELFRYSKTTGGTTNPDGVSGDAIAFVNLLLEPLSHPEYPIYIVLTMRSDFLGECSKFDGLPEVINESQYLVPRLTRDERRAAISGPVCVVGGELSPVLLTRTVNDVGDNPDQLSIMQHAINRTWAHWQEDHLARGSVSLEDYEAVGTMARALDEHAEEAFRKLEPGRQQTLCEKVFKALTDRGTDARGIRRPMPFRTLCAVVAAAPEELTPVLDVFRDPSRSFLMPPLAEALEPETIIDISHEILMRVWERLKRWAEEEARSAGRYKYLAEGAELYNNGREVLLHGVGLETALEWKWRTEPNAAWAQMYRGGFENAMEFLEASKRAGDSERAEAAFQRRWRRFTPYIGAFVFIVFLVISPKISNSLRPIIKPRLERILKTHERKPDLPAANAANGAVGAINQANPIARPRTKAANEPLADLNPPPGFDAIENLGEREFTHKVELAETMINTVGYGLGGLISSLLYAFLWIVGKRAYRRFAFPGILLSTAIRFSAPEPTTPQTEAVLLKDGANALSGEPVAAELKIAGMRRRLLAGLVDFIVFMGLGMLSIVAVVVDEDIFSIPNGSAKEYYGIFAFWLVFDYLYQTLTKHWGWQKTLGDLVCGLSVTDLNGRRPSFGRISNRYLVRAVPWLLFYGVIGAVQAITHDPETFNIVLGFSIFGFPLLSLLALVTVPFNKRRMTVYDMIAGTLVVHRPRKPKAQSSRFDPAEAA